MANDAVTVKKDYTVDIWDSWNSNTLNQLRFNEAPNSHWSDVGFGEHFVQFYQEDVYIVDSVAEYFIHCLKSNGIGIAAATRKHLDEIEKKITGFGVDLESARREGRFIELDAEETLEMLLVDGSVDDDLFFQVIGSLVEKSAQQGREIRIFGELVNVLCTRENYRAAANLEKLWDSLRLKHPFSLFCAYATAGFRDASPASRMAGICNGHSRVIPDESYTSLTSTKDRMQKIATLQQRVKQLELELTDVVPPVQNAFAPLN